MAVVCFGHSPAHAMSEKAIGDIIDLQRYPLTGDKSAIVKEAAERYRRNGVCLLPGFLTTGGVSAMSAEVEALQGEAFRCDDHHNAYLASDDGSLPEDHPRRQRQHTRLNVLGYDQLSPAGALVRLFHFDGLNDFLGRILGIMPLHRFADPVGAITVNTMHEGDGHGWHYDEAQFTVSVMLQAPLAGGEYEYVSGLRSAGFDDIEGLGRVLAGERTGVTTVPITPGALMLFAGQHLLHRVCPVGGHRMRHVATLSYRDRPGMMNSPDVRMLFYGRREPRPRAIPS